MMRVHAGSIRATIVSIRKTLADERKAAKLAVKTAGDLYYKTVQRNVSLRDHSLAELAAQDHPYAHRHGAIRIHERGSGSLLHPQYRVHTHTGTLLSAIKGGMSTRGASYRVEADTGLAPHAQYVIQGTRVMLARDVLWDTALAPQVQVGMMRAFVRVLGRITRTQAAVRFERGTGTGLQVP